MEFTSFEANAAQSAEKRRMVILRCEDAPLLGLFAPHVYQDLVGIGDAEERRSRILAAAEGRSQVLEPPPRSFIGVPPRIATFTGRANELDRLDAILMRDKPAAVTQASVGRAAVQGMGGVGKTSLAIEYAHRFRGLYAGVCWCPSETRTGLLSALAGLAVTLGSATAEEADVEKAAKAALRRLAEQRATWLLVYDNVPAPDAITDLLPSAGARVLITSRFSDWSELADDVALDVLPLEEAVAFLQSRTGRSDAVGAKRLAEALGNLPLALDHAAAYCKRTQATFAHYAEKASNLIGAAPRGAGYPRSVGATFDLAITEAVAQCTAAEPLMAYIAQCAPERIPMTLVEGAVEDEGDRSNAIAALAEVSLLKHDPFEDGTPAVIVHRLVQAVARARSEANGSVEYAVRRLFARLVGIYPQAAHNDPRSWPLCSQLTAHLLARREAGFDPSSDWPVFDRASNYLYGRAAYSQAAPLLRDALAIREKALGPEHPDTASSLNNLASLLEAQGDLEGARPLFERALAIREKALGPEHPKTATSLNNLASLLVAKGDIAAATRPLFERALAIREKALGREHPETASSLNNLACLLQDHGDLAVARPLFERTLAIAEKTLGPDHPNTATSLNNLASLLQAQGDVTAARPLFERALAICEKALGPEHPKSAASLNNLALLLRDQGDFAAARPLLERALAVREKALGREHQDTELVRCNLSRLLLLVGRPTEALSLGETALSAHEKIFGRDHTWTKDSARVTADALDALGRTEEAKALRERYGVASSDKPKPS
jgi:tetratricopeptide (TPR) repeat protein